MKIQAVKNNVVLPTICHHMTREVIQSRHFAVTYSFTCTQYLIKKHLLEWNILSLEEYCYSHQESSPKLGVIGVVCFLSADRYNSAHKITCVITYSAM